MNALILGGADCVWQDLRDLATLLGGGAIIRGLQLPLWDGIVIAVNDIGIHYPLSVDHWVTLHPDKFANWKKQREAEWGMTDDVPVTWCHSDGAPQLDKTLPIRHGQSGTSGLFAVQVAQHLGAERIVLCGIPMTRTPHFFDDKPWGDEHFEGYRRAWTTWKERGELDDVRSMSGWTREICGAPVASWLMSGPRVVINKTAATGPTKQMAEFKMLDSNASPADIAAAYRMAAAAYECERSAARIEAIGKITGTADDAHQLLDRLED